MYKKLLSTGTLLIAASAATSSFAQVSLSLGVQSSELDIETQNEMFIPNDDININRTESNNNTGLGGELALGYQYDINTTFDIAVEIFGQLSGAETKTPLTADSGGTFFVFGGVPFKDSVASFDWIAGLRLRPGYNLTHSTRLFVDGGIVLGGFEVTHNDQTVDAINAIIGENWSNSEDSTLFGWRYGVGAEHKVTEHFVIGVDYSITQFDTYSSDYIEDASEVFSQPNHFDSLVALNTKYEPTLYVLGLNFKYLFGAKPQRHNEMQDK